MKKRINNFKKSFSKLFIGLGSVFLLTTLSVTPAWAGPSFGSRNAAPQAPEPAVAAAPATPAAQVSTAAAGSSRTGINEASPPNINGVDWLRVPYDKAEN